MLNTKVSLVTPDNTAEITIKPPNHAAYILYESWGYESASFSYSCSFFCLIYAVIVVVVFIVVGICKIAFIKQGMSVKIFSCLKNILLFCISKRFGLFFLFYFYFVVGIVPSNNS